MGNLVGKIVLTGGPCAGKTTALSKIEENLTERGYKVFVVGESATELIKGGIRPFGKTAFDMFDFQNVIVQHQLNKEKIYENSIKFLSDEQKCIIVYDLGVLDNKAYIGQEKFNKVLDSLNLKELELMDSYDMIIHLVTAADGKEEHYTLANNEARTETVEEAKAIDSKTANAWVGHNNIKIIDNSTEFEDKLNRVLNEVYNLVGDPVSIRKQRKFLVDMNNSTLDFVNENECTEIEIQQTYLKPFTKDKECENRLRKRTYKGESTHYLTVQKKKREGISKVITDKKITEKEYEKMLSTYETEKEINKIRYTFIRDKQYFRLDMFDREDGLAILEVEQGKYMNELKLPKEIEIVKEVTNDPLYQNGNLPESFSKESQKIKVY